MSSRLVLGRCCCLEARTTALSSVQASKPLNLLLFFSNRRLYLDNDFRITRGNKGSVFLHTRDSAEAEEAA